MWLLVIFVAVPIVEIAIFIQVGGLIGLWPTLGIVVLTAVAGTILVRTQGIETLRRLQASLERGGDPLDPIAHGALILVAGVLLLTPGFFTDAVGLALLVPGVRVALIRWGAARVAVLAAGPPRRPDAADRPGARGEPPRRPGPRVVDADYEVVDESPPDPGRRSGWRRPPD